MALQVEAAKAGRALAQVQQVQGVSISGHPNSDFDGVYKHDSTHEGWPVLKSAKGKFCFRHTPRGQWLLRGEFKPDSDTCNAHFETAEGPLPVGSETWQCWHNAQFVGRTLTVALLVRHLHVFVASCHAAAGAKI